MPYTDVRPTGIQSLYAGPTMFNRNVANGSVIISSGMSGIKLAPPIGNFVHAIVNPAAGNGRGEKQWPEFARKLTEHGFSVEAHHTTGPGDATTIARELADRSVDTVVVAGGDGTVNETINGLIANDVPVSPNTRMAIIPCGTGRDLGRSFGMKSIDYAIRSLELNAWTTVDVGKASFIGKDSGESTTRYFINVGDVGLGAETANRINNTSKRFGGFASYLYGALVSIAAFKPQELTLELDGEQVFEGAANMVLFANGRFHAGGMLVAPEASFHDGELDIFVLEDVGKRKMITSLLPRVYRGKHVGQHGIQHFKGKIFKVSSPDPLRIEMDGEQPGNVPADIRIIPGCLKVFGAGAMLT